MFDKHSSLDFGFLLIEYLAKDESIAFMNKRGKIPVLNFSGTSVNERTLVSL